MATTLVYGSVTFTNVTTKVFSQETEYDESGADPINTKTTIRVFGVACINESGTNKGFITGPGGANAGAHANLIVAALWEPRQNLTYTIGSGVVLQCGGVALNADMNNRDVNNGPKPRHVSIVNVRGDKSVWVEFEVECALVRCTSQGSDGILSNRWAMVDDIDENHYSTRSIEGVVRFAHVNVSQGAIRNTIMPPLTFGFVRQAINVTIQPDGLAARYRITDRQVFATPPSPLTKWKGTFTLSTADHGISEIAEVVVSGEAPPHVLKKDVITKVVQIAYSKINLSKLNQSNVFLESFSVVESMDTNNAEVRFRLRFPGQSTLFEGDKSQLGSVLALPGYTTGVSALPSIFGATTSAGLWVCYLQTPCGGNSHNTSLLNSGGDAQQIKTALQGDTPETTVTSGAVPPFPTKQLSQEHLESLYTYYSVKSEYPVTPNRVQCPIARSTSSSGSSSQSASQATAVIVQVAKSCARRIITISAERVGKEPSMPEVTDTYEDASGAKAFLMFKNIMPRAPVPGPDGSQKLYAVDAVYEYALDRPLSDSVMVIGQLPWVSGSGGGEGKFELKPRGQSEGSIV